ncbi:elongation factor 1-gamma [Erpetoichthys calabaricus]|uniref:Eukaryotic translation elongation factor 1 gamma n=1 Tax=Erpetoichthys calabaricus TaxID=27687 RepID=A0A8C4X9G4_ERPCA|nr:elongation factor 1-gamma [Erpetoichthys calabaricus]
MANGTLYTYPDNWRAFKPLIAAQYSGAKIKVASSPPQFHFGQTNKTPEFLQKFPLGKVPAFQGDDGFCLFESNAIAHYLSSEALRGSTKEAAAQVLQWVSFADSEIVPPASTWVFPTLGIMQYNKQATEHAKEEVRKVLSVLNEHLQSRTFLVGERLTLADITVVCSLLWLYKQVLEPSFRQSFLNTNRWFITCINQPQFKAVLGEVKLCEKMAQFDAKKFAELQPKKEATPKKEKAPKESKQPEKKEKKEKKEEKPEAAQEEEMDECEAVLASEPKAKDPFAHLPKSTFVLDEFKRKYSNEDTLTVALPHFWEHFDREGYSIWFGEYRFPEELAMTFMSCNLITGMFQRLEKLRKNAFASVILFGANNDSSISGIWVFRGQDLAFTLCEDWQIDYESYAWRKLDVDSDECKTMVKEYFAWEGEFKHVGKPFNQGKIFK